MSAQEYTAPVVQQARDYAAAGFTIAEIHRMLNGPSEITIKRWVWPDYNARSLASNARRRGAARAQVATFRLSSDTAAYQRAFAVRLRQEGLSYDAIAKVGHVVFNACDWNEDRVRYILKGRRG